jgi:protocatechuate 3,4-dioxygenase beta subunit
MTVTAFAVSALFLFQTGRGSIEGVVVDSLTNRPIAGAQVAATRMPVAPGPPGTAQGATTAVVSPTIVTAAAGGVIVGTNGPLSQIVQVAPAKTDKNGNFAFRDLEPGTYQLRATADGYAQQEYGPQPAGRTTLFATVNLSDGEAAKGTVFRLTPGGTVSGRVTGSSGEPLVNIEVSLYRSAYDPNGRKTLQSAGSAQTNDRGEYRIFWVTPGRYYLSAVSSNRPIVGVPFNPQGFRNKYPRTFYPSTKDPATAGAIDIQPAAELAGMDFRLNEEPTYHVRGRIVDSSSGQSPPRAAITMMSRDSLVANTSLFSFNPYNATNGTFDVADVPAGSYMIRAQLPLNAPPGPGQPPTPPMAIAPVDVGNADVDGVVLTFLPPASISGHIRIEGDPSPQNFRASVLLRPGTIGLSIPPRPAQVAADGTFTIDGVAPGEYQVTANGSAGQGGLYVKEIRFGPTDVLTHPLSIEGPVVDIMEIVFSTGTGQISGIVRGDSQQLLPRVQVVLIPNQRDRHDLYRTTSTDTNGHFVLRSIPPGSYKLFAWEGIEQFSWFDDSVLARYETQGIPTTVNVSSDVTLDVRMIPASTRR